MKSRIPHTDERTLQNDLFCITGKEHAILFIVNDALKSVSRMTAELRGKNKPKQENNKIKTTCNFFRMIKTRLSFHTHIIDRWWRLDAGETGI